MREFKVRNGSYLKSKNKTSDMMYTILIILSFFILFSTYKNGIYPVIKGYGSLYLVFKPLIFVVVASITGLLTEYLYYLIRKNKKSIYELLTGNYTYQYAVDKTDPEVVYYKHQVAYTPRHTAGASLALENPFINASLHATGVSKRYIASENRPSNEMDGYIEYGLSLYRSFKIKKFTYNLRGDIINLGNKQYDIVKSYPMPGRSYKLTCSIHF